MTLVVTTPTIRGITVVDDKAENEYLGELSMVKPTSKKVFYSEAANISLAIWGNAVWPRTLGAYSDWFAKTVVAAVRKGTSLADAGQFVCDSVNAVSSASWARTSRASSRRSCRRLCRRPTPHLPVSHGG